MALLLIVLMRSRPEKWPTFKETSDTVTTKTEKTKVDTFFIDRPVPVKVKEVKYVKVAAERTKNDENYAQNPQEIIRDSVELPITQKEYQDSTYHAWVSGYDPVLDSIRVYQKERLVTQTVTVTNTKTETIVKHRRLSLGLQGGYGYGIVSKRFEPYVGIGFSLGL
jgi:hypothetical protein